MRKVIILRGLPGSGKSTERKRLVETLGADSGSADDFFINPVTKLYEYDGSKIGLAHASCMRKFIDHLASHVDYHVAGYETVCCTPFVVDNTNTTSVEIAPYVAVANAFEWAYEIKLIECDPEVAFARQTHGVPRKTFDHMARNLKIPLPGYW